MEGSDKVHMGSMKFWNIRIRGSLKMKWGHFKMNVEKYKVLNLSSIYSGLPSPWYLKATNSTLAYFLTTMITTKILSCKIFFFLKRIIQWVSITQWRTEYISKIKELIHMSWHVYRWERITASSSKWNTNDHRIIHGWMRWWFDLGEI